MRWLLSIGVFVLASAVGAWLYQVTSTTGAPLAIGIIGLIVGCMIVAIPADGDSQAERR